MKTILPENAAADGLERFQPVLNEISSLILKSKNKKDKALFFYEAGLRNYLFKAEGLCRIYRGIVSKKTFEPLLETFKQLEDQMGKIDFYDGFLKEFASHKKLPVSFLRFFTEGKEKEVKALNDIIMSGSCFLKEAGKLNAIKSTLTEVKWPDRDEERKLIIRFLAEQIDKLVVQYEDGELHFNDIEHGLHEFRRKLRWIGIYAQALNGFVQLKKVNDIPISLKSYMTPDIVSSPYNKMNAVPTGIEPATIKEPLFYALSWLIQESGKLKDAGLKIKVVNQALDESKIKTKESIATIKTELLPKGSISLSQISEHMEQITDVFIHKEQVLHLIRRDLLRSLYS